MPSCSTLGVEIVRNIILDFVQDRAGFCLTQTYWTYQTFVSDEDSWLINSGLYQDGNIISGALKSSIFNLTNYEMDKTLCCETVRTKGCPYLYTFPLGLVHVVHRHGRPFKVKKRFCQLFRTSTFLLKQFDVMPCTQFFFFQ